MGILFTKFYDLIQSKVPCRILMVGLDGAGKTTLLYKLKLGEIVSTIPTIGFNVETIEYKNIAFTVWDIGGQERLRSLWRHYYPNTKGIIYVVDTNDPSRLSQARDELYAMIEFEELRNCPLLIYANKQDLPHATDLDTVIKLFRLDLKESRSWSVQPSCAVSGSGVYEGLDWLASRIK